MDMSVDRMLGIFGVLGIVIGVGVAIAMDPKIKNEMVFAIGCFIFSGIALSLTVGIWAFNTEFPAAKRVFIAGPLFVLICISMVEASRWAQGRYYRATAETNKKRKPPDSDSAQPRETGEKTADIPKEPLVRKDEIHGKTDKVEAKPEHHGTTDEALTKLGHAKPKEPAITPGVAIHPEMGFHESTAVFFFTLGENGISASATVAGLRMGQKPFVGFPITVFAKDTDNKIHYRISIWNGMSPVEVTDDEFSLHEPFWDRNFDKTTLEIVDEKQAPVLQVMWKTPTNLVINGIFRLQNGSVVIADSNGWRPMKLGDKIKPLFKYPSRRFQGQYVDQ